jgi:hypothetical protein|tara:strand:+ start:222 stop:362 length:141 start_codon:yes stop_codon:yes gene_type:complete
MAVMKSYSLQLFIKSVYEGLLRKLLISVYDRSGIPTTETKIAMGAM